MLKITGTMKDGRALVMLGLSDQNLARLKAGDLIYFDAAQLELPAGQALGAIALWYGSDEAELAHIVQQLVGPETTVIVIPHGPPGDPA